VSASAGKAALCKQDGLGVSHQHTTDKQVEEDVQQGRPTAPRGSKSWAAFGCIIAGGGRANKIWVLLQETQWLRHAAVLRRTRCRMHRCLLAGGMQGDTRQLP
jgi:hypothetical protein